MKRLGALLTKGLVATLPLGLTIYAVYWLVTTTESLMHDFLLLFIDPGTYRPGMGLFVGLLILLGMGALVNAYIVRREAREALDRLRLH